ncbi:MAG: hypothetical protein IPM79_25740 [Polyangiaceae bacterium]|nr:hypothetical protein [Polyangiaceae bacterium]
MFDATRSRVLLHRLRELLAADRGHALADLLQLLDELPQEAEVPGVPRLAREVPVVAIEDEVRGGALDAEAFEGRPHLLGGLHEDQLALVQRHAVREGLGQGRGVRTGGEGAELVEVALQVLRAGEQLLEPNRLHRASIFARVALLVTLVERSELFFDVFEGLVGHGGPDS